MAGLRNLGNPNMKNLLALQLLLVAAVALGGCSSLRFPGVYRIAVQQGNIIEQKKVDQLELGMSKRQVEYVMGSPMVRDPLHPDRWDYIYQLRRAGETLRDRRFTVLFEGDTLVGFEGDYKPGARETPADNYIEDAKQTEAGV